MLVSENRVKTGKSTAVATLMYKFVLLFNIFLFMSCSHVYSAALVGFGQEKPEDSVDKLKGVVSKSHYLKMKDGINIAVDVAYPNHKKKTYPTVLWSTRYWRSFELRFFPAPSDRAPINHRGDLPDYFLANGYAVVFVDVRGTGASEGEWIYPWSAEERSDIASVIDWVGKQEWSNGKVATMGLSYEGSTALLAAAEKPESLSAVVARQFEFDIYRDLAFPGGIYNKWFIETWAEGNDKLDQNGTPSFFPWYAGIFIKGPRAVSDDFKRVEEIISKRTINNVHDAMKQIVYRDDFYGKTKITQDDFSPFKFINEISASKVPIFTWGSWHDASTADSVIRSFINFNNSQVAVIGSWDHMAERQGSPYGEIEDEPIPAVKTQWREMRDFLNNQLDFEKKVNTKQLIYYTMAEEKWKFTDQWPLKNTVQKQYYFSNDNQLLNQPPTKLNDADSDEYVVDFTATTGTNNRWHTEMAKKVDYGDWQKRDEKLLVYDTAVFDQDTEITGHPIVHLYLTSTHFDGAIYVYLEDVHPDGRVTHMTEGQLRILHRKLSNERSPYKQAGPYRSFKRKDASELKSKEIADMKFTLLPTSVLIRKGHKVRVAIAGHDADTFVRIPETGEPVITVLRNKEYPSHIQLPVIKKQ